MMIKNKIKKVFNQILFPLIFVLSFSLNALCCTQLQDFQLDKMSYNLINYNKILGNSEYFSPILNVEKKEEKIIKDKTPFYNDLFNQFHYNVLTNGARTLVNSNTNMCVGDSYYGFKITVQPTYLVSNTNEGTDEHPVYHLEYGQYYSYFPEIVQRHRGGNDVSFVFISDTLADKIVKKLNIPGDTILDKYRELITNEKYCFLNMQIDETKIARLSINNVLYSNFNDGHSKRMSFLYGDFALAWIDSIKNDLRLSFEIDLKTNPYGNKNVIKGLMQMGYDSSNSLFSIKSIDSEGTYHIDQTNTNVLYGAIENSSSVFWYVDIIFINLLTIFICFYLCFCKKSNISGKKLLIVSSVIFIIYGLVVTFTYNYPLFTISPLISFFIALTVFVKNLKIGSFKEPNIGKIGKYYEVDI